MQTNPAVEHRKSLDGQRVRGNQSGRKGNGLLRRLHVTFAEEPSFEFRMKY